MAQRGDYRKLIVWRKSMDVVKEVYTISADFPKHEIYGLTSQIRRSSVSMPANIGEGNEKKSDKEFIRYLEISKGSCVETMIHVQIANELGYLGENAYKTVYDKLQEIRSMLGGFINKLS